MTFHKYIKIKPVGYEENVGIFSDPEDEIVIEEKVDGGNFRFMVKDGNIIFGSRTQQLTSNEGEETNVSKNFRRCVNFIKDKFEAKPKKFLEGSIYYGECMVKHSIGYDWEITPPFLGYDIFNLTVESFIENKEELFESADLPHVPIIKKCKAKDIKELSETDVPKSAFYPGQAEGIVIKNYAKQIFAKIVTEKFKEVNKETFGGSKKFAENDDAVLVAMYCTNPRIDKAIFKLVDDGQKLELPMMKYLPIAVVNDIYEEHSFDICKSGWIINFKNVRKKVTKRCLAVLRQMITNNALAEK